MFKSYAYFDDEIVNEHKVQDKWIKVTRKLKVVKVDFSEILAYATTEKPENKAETLLQRQPSIGNLDQEVVKSDYLSASSFTSDISQAPDIEESKTSEAMDKKTDIEIKIEDELQTIEDEIQQLKINQTPDSNNAAKMSFFGAYKSKASKNFDEDEHKFLKKGKQRTLNQLLTLDVDFSQNPALKEKVQEYVSSSTDIEYVYKNFHFYKRNA